jgi:hypothetical protein
MNTELYDMLIDRLKVVGVSFDPGLTDVEVDQAEEAGHFRFPPDLREFLQRGVPGRYARRVAGGDRSQSRDFPNWRKQPDKILTRSQKRLIDGLRASLLDSYQPDYKAAVYWPEAWGERPAKLSSARSILDSKWHKAPRLLPIWGHRYLPADPAEAGNPVFSIMGVDIIHYGVDLLDYFVRDFHIEPLVPKPEQPRPIPFWDDFLA